MEKADNFNLTCHRGLTIRDISKLGNGPLMKLDATCVWSLDFNLDSHLFMICILVQFPCILLPKVTD